MSTTTESRICEWPQRLKRQRTKGWTKPEDSICVTRGPRPSKWGNPFAVKKGEDAAVAVLAYRMYLSDNPELVADARAELAGKTLLCWCDLGAPCHAEVLIEVANTPADAWGKPIGSGVADIDADLLSEALLRGAETDAEADAIDLLTDWSAEYLNHDAVRALIGVRSAPGVPLAHVDWDALSLTLMTTGLAVPDHVAAAWAVAAHIAIELPIAAERALSDMDCYTAMRALELLWEGPK